MKKRNKMVLSAAVAGLIAAGGMVRSIPAFADDNGAAAGAPAATDGGTATAPAGDKDGCKGKKADKDHCKGKKGKDHCKGKHKKANGCSGPNGCKGKGKKADDAAKGDDAPAKAE